jgi:DNA-binding transcriptional MocR family regulator
VLLGKARTADVIDAALVLLAVDGDTILTSDPSDLGALASAAGLHVDVVRI